MLPFLDVLVTKNPDGSLGRSVQETHTDLYLHANSQHHPSQKHAVLTVLINRAKTICDITILNAEIRDLRDAFRQNGYSVTDLNRAMYHRNKTTTE
jgi:hypothetical protein